VRYHGAFAYLDGALVDGQPSRYADCGTTAPPTSGAYQRPTLSLVRLLTNEFVSDR
jgi:hypothetical protein